MTRYSLAQLTVLHASPPELIRIAAAAGYDFVGLRLLEVTNGDSWPLVSDARLLRQTRQALSSTGVGVLDIELVRLTSEFDAAKLRPTLDVAAELGARHVLTQAHDEHWPRLADNFGSLCDLLLSYGLTADVEFLTWTKMRGVNEAFRLLRTANRSNAGLTVDTLHFYRSGCDIEDLRAVPPELLHFVQISDAPAAGPASIEGLIFAAREDRLDPGTGELDLAAVLRVLPEDVTIAVEIPNSRLAGELTDEERARSALVATKTVVEKVKSERPSTL